MGRRRDDDDDDNDDDDLPVRRPQKKGSKTIWIVLGIILLVVFLIVGVCVGGCIYVYKKAESNVNDINDSFRGTIESDSFLTSLSSNQTQTAYDSTAPNFKATMSRDGFEQLLKRYPLLTKNSTHRKLSSNAPTGTSPNRKLTNTYEYTKLFDDPEPFVPAGQPRPPKVPPGPRTITVAITVAEQAGGFWKVENISVQ